MTLDFFVILKKWSSTIMLSVTPSYSLCDLLFDVNIYDWPTTWRYASNTVLMSAIPLPSAQLCKLWFPFLNHLIDGDLCKKILLFPYFLFFLVFNHDFVIYMDFFPCRSFQQSNWWRHKLGHTEYLIQTQHSYAPFLLKIDEKCGGTGGL